MKKTIQTTIRLQEELYKELKRRAREKGISFNAIVITTLWKDEAK